MLDREELTARRLKSLLNYDPHTGNFTWRITRGGKLAGSQAGSPHIEGYVCIRVDKQLHLAHRLAWLYTEGVWPSQLIDHKDGVRSNNRRENLRDASRRVNQENRHKARKDSASGLLGVRWDPERSLWRSRIKVNGKEVHLGRFETEQEAVTAHLKAKRRLHEGCTI